MAPVSTSVPAAVVLKAVRGWRLFPCRTEVDRAVMAAHPSHPAGGTGCRWLMPAAGDGRPGGRQLGVTAGTRRCGLVLPAADRHARSRRTGRVGPCCAGLLFAVAQNVHDGDVQRGYARA